MARRTRTVDRATADLLRALLKAVEDGELEANTPQARRLVVGIEGAISALDPTPPEG
jgi:hypothetical protein